jgi:tetratricopeptide (TPR) repeat protein
MGENENVIGIAEDLISRKIYLSDAYYMKGEAEFNLKWYHKAKASFENALKQSPEDAETKNYIQYISGLIGQGNNTSIKKTIKPVPIPDEIAEVLALSRADSVNSADYGAYYISNIQSIHFQKNGDQRITTYTRIKLLDKSGVSAYSTIEMEFDPLSEEPFVNTLEVKDECGKKVSTGDCSNYYILDNRSSDMATHDKILNIPIPNLKPGYTIELISTRKYNDKNFVYYWGTLSKHRPVQYSAIVVTGDTELLLKHSSNIPGTTPVKNGIAWVMTNPPVFKWEPFQEKIDDFLPVIRIADSRKTWKKIGDDYLDEISSKLVLDEKTRTLASSLSSKATTREDKIKALVSHIQSDYTYKAIEFGKRAVVPNTSKETIEKKYGDCKDHAVLLHQMLKAISIPSFLVLVNTQSDIQESIPSLDQFNHMIVYVPDHDKGYFIDTTSKHLDMMSFIPIGLSNQKALILEKGNIHLKTIPTYSKESYSVSVNTDVRVNGDRNLAVSEKIVFKGYPAAFMRDYLSSVDKLSYTNWFQKLYTDKIPKSSAFKITVENMDSYLDDLAFNISYDVEDSSEQTEKGLSFTLPDVWMAYYLEVQPVPDRKTDFKLSYPMALSKRMNVELPKIFSKASVIPTEKTKDDTFGKWQTKITEAPSSLTLSFSIACPDGHFDKTAYPAFKNFFDLAIEAASPKFVLK